MNALTNIQRLSDYIFQLAVAYPGIFSGRGVQQIQLRTEDGERMGDLWAVAPKSGVLEAAVIWYKKFHFI